MEGWRLPRDLVLYQFLPWCAYVCTPKVALVCRAWYAETQKARYWERAVRAGLARLLAGHIDPTRLAAINVFAEDPRTLYGVSALSMRQRVGWLFPHSDVKTCLVNVLLSSVYTRLCIRDDDDNNGLTWTWLPEDPTSFSIGFGHFVDDHGQPLFGHLIIKTFPLHPTARQQIFFPDGKEMYHIYDPTKDCTWIGSQAKVKRDKKTGFEYFVPEGNGMWIRGDISM
jgi:hypothetical protein